MRLRYLTLNKAELVERWLSLEQSLAEQDELFQSLNDNLLEWRLRAEVAALVPRRLRDRGYRPI